MSSTTSPPASPLSEYESDDFPEEVKREDRSVSVDMHNNIDVDTRPTKRQRTGGGPSWDTRRLNTEHVAPPVEDDSISEDTDGSVPASPTHGMPDEESLGQEQVTVCKWEGCGVGDLGDMDMLVKHLHDSHIGTRQKKYSCEWVDCSRKGIPHASGYALRAHMRSHTREKPFYCSLPECDRAFTRSDALAKHMRTVHETEALRPSDPVPKHHSSNPLNKSQRLRITFNKSANSPQPGAAPVEKTSTPGSPSQAPAKPLSHEAEWENNNVAYLYDNSRAGDDSDAQLQSYTLQFPPDIHFSPYEASLPAAELFRLLRRQLAWATQDGKELQAEIEELEKVRREEWMRKELVLENVMEAELGVAERKGRMADGLELGLGVTIEERALRRMEEDAKASRGLVIEGGVPWWRERPATPQREEDLGDDVQEESALHAGGVATHMPADDEGNGLERLATDAADVQHADESVMLTG